MDNKYNIFISWSGRRSQIIAEALKSWLPKVLKGANPWISAEDIGKGTRGYVELSKALQMKVAISCITAENKDAPWILYEAGALSKTRDKKTKFCTYLLDGVTVGDLSAPLSAFQATNADEKSTRQLVNSINSAINRIPVPEAYLDHSFARNWPTLSQALQQLPAKTLIESGTYFTNIGDLYDAFATTIEKVDVEVKSIKKLTLCALHTAAKFSPAPLPNHDIRFQKFDDTLIKCIRSPHWLFRNLYNVTTMDRFEHVLSRLTYSAEGYEVRAICAIELIPQLSPLIIGDKDAFICTGDQTSNRVSKAIYIRGTGAITFFNEFVERQWERAEYRLRTIEGIDNKAVKKLRSKVSRISKDRMKQG